MDIAINGGRDKIVALLEKYSGTDKKDTAPTQGVAEALTVSGSLADSLPRIDPIKDFQMPGADIAYFSSASVKESLNFYNDQLIEKGWAVTSTITDYKNLCHASV